MLTYINARPASRIRLVEHCELAAVLHHLGGGDSTRADPQGTDYRKGVLGDS